MEYNDFIISVEQFATSNKINFSITKDDVDVLLFASFEFKETNSELQTFTNHIGHMCLSEKGIMVEVHHHGLRSCSMRTQRFGTTMETAFAMLKIEIENRMLSLIQQSAFQKLKPLFDEEKDESVIIRDCLKRLKNNDDWKKEYHELVSKNDLPKREIKDVEHICGFSNTTIFIDEHGDVELKYGRLDLYDDFDYFKRKYEKFC